MRNIISLALVAVLAVWSPVMAGGFEENTDRPGMDYQQTILPQADPELCRDLCLKDSHCLAYTYVKPGVQGPEPICYLKNPVPDAVVDECCVSGIKSETDLGLEMNTNRPGNDIRDFDLDQADPGLCRQACSKSPDCLAFTYVKPGIQGEKARCWLKDAVPDAEENDCCISGLK